MSSSGGKSGSSGTNGNVQAQAENMSPASKADFVDTRSHVSEMVGETMIYTVVAGDTLPLIAEHFYGNAEEGRLIFEANRDQLTGPDRIKPGQMLKIPAKP